MLDPALIGSHLLVAVATSRQMGHASPSNSMLYVEARTPEAQFVRDVLTECKFGGNPEATARLDVVAESLADVVAAAVTR